MNTQQTVTIHARRLQETDKAVLVETPQGRREWLPKRLTDWSEYTTSYQIPLWLARKKNLA